MCVAIFLKMHPSTASSLILLLGRHAVEKLVEDLHELTPRCASMLEGRGLSQHVVERVMHVLDRIEAHARESDSALARSAKPFYDAVECFTLVLVEFLNPPKSPLQRIAAQQVLAQDVKKAHEALDSILRDLGEESQHWQQRFEEARALQHQQLKQALDQTRLIESDRALIDQVLKTFKTDTLAKKAMETLAPADLEWMRMIYFKLFRVVRSLPVNPEWYIYGREVKINGLGDCINLGPFGEVVSGTWGRGTNVSIRKLQLINDETQRDLMVSEITLWYKFNHPHVLKLFGACHNGRHDGELPPDHDGFPFFVCEDALPGHIGNFVTRPLNQNKMWRAIYEASLGLYYLHSQRIAHGDLRCRNIRIGVDNKAKLSNFYCSVKRDEAAQGDVRFLPSASDVKWKAPECVDGSLPTLPSDIYSFGMCIVEAVTWARNDDHLVKGFVSSGKQPSELKDGAWRLVQRMCADDPKSRPSIVSVVDDLNALMRQEAAQNVVPKANKFCTNCGNSMATSANFCNKCGTRVGAASIAPLTHRA